MRVVFFGTPAVAAEYLRAIDRRHQLVGVVTQPDRPRGRGRKVSPSPVKQTALELGIAVAQPTNLLADAFPQQLRAWAAEVFVVVSYGEILPLSLIKMPPQGSVNVHYSLLPKLRGAAPVQRALMEGLTETGITVQYIHEEFDAGDVILQTMLAIEPEDNAVTLTQRLTVPGIPLLMQVLDLLVAGEVEAQPQDREAATLAPSLTREDGLIDWCRPAREVVNQVRGCFPWPGANCLFGDQRLKITQAAVVGAEQYGGGDCGEVVEIISGEGFVVQAKPGAVLIRELQPAGRRIMSAADFVRGARLKEGTRLEPISI